MTRREEMALCPEPDLLAMARALLDPDRRGALCTAGLTPEQVTKLAVRIGRAPTARRPLHPLVSPDARIESLTAWDYASKDAAVARVGDWAARLLPPRHSGAVEQALDEMLLNALYDAPQGQNGPRYARVPPQDRVLLQSPPGEHAEVRFGSDARRVVVAVRDRFGALRRATVLRYLIHCATAQAGRRSPIEPKVGGAGVGLYLIAGAASELIFRLRAGRLTEVVFCAYRDRRGPLRALILDETA